MSDLQERVAVAENNIEHLQVDVNEIARLMREANEANGEKLDDVLKIVNATNTELTRYKIISGTALALIGGLIAGGNYLMGIFGVSLSDLWSKSK